MKSSIQEGDANLGRLSKQAKYKWLKIADCALPNIFR